jgi:hypothetical protein
LNWEHLGVQAKEYLAKGPEIHPDRPGAYTRASLRARQEFTSFQIDHRCSSALRRLIMVRTGVDEDGLVYFLIHTVKADPRLNETMGCIQHRCYYRGRVMIETLRMIKRLHDSEGTDIFVVAAPEQDLQNMILSMPERAGGEELEMWQLLRLILVDCCVIFNKVIVKNKKLNKHFRNMEEQMARAVGLQIPVYTPITLSKERAVVAKQWNHVSLQHPYMLYDIDVNDLPLPGTPVGQVILNRLESGHILCGEYYRKTKWDRSQPCDCGDNFQRIEHVLWECQKHDQHRMTSKTNKWSKNRELIMNYEDSHKAVVKYIPETNPQPSCASGGNPYSCWLGTKDFFPGH